MFSLLCYVFWSLVFSCLILQCYFSGSTLLLFVVIRRCQSIFCAGQKFLFHSGFRYWFIDGVLVFFFPLSLAFALSLLTIIKRGKKTDRIRKWWWWSFLVFVLHWTNTGMRVRVRAKYWSISKWGKKEYFFRLCRIDQLEIVKGFLFLSSNQTNSFRVVVVAMFLSTQDNIIIKRRQCAAEARGAESMQERVKMEKTIFNNFTLWPLNLGSLEPTRTRKEQQQTGPESQQNIETLASLSEGTRQICWRWWWWWFFTFRSSTKACPSKPVSHNWTNIRSGKKRILAKNY